MNENISPSAALLELMFAKIVESVTEQVAARVEAMIATKLEEAFDELDLEDKVERAVETQLENMDLEDKVERAVENIDLGDAVLEVIKELDFSVSVSR
jgi:hypothetical protein